MKKLILSIAAFLAFITASSAQRVGWEIGAASSNYIGTVDGNLVDSKAKLGFRAGADFHFKLARHLTLETDLLFVNNGFKQNTAYGMETVNIQAIQIPFVIEFRSGRDNKHGFFVGGGPFVSYHISGQTKIDLASGYYSVGPNPDKLHFGSGTNQIKRMDAGLGINGGYEFRDGIFMRLYYQMGVVNLSNANNELVISTNAGLSVGYMIPGKKSGSNNHPHGNNKVHPYQKRR